MPSDRLFYLDTSAILKRYLTEGGSDNILHLFDYCDRRGDGVATSVYTPLEVCSAAERLCNAGAISPAARDRFVYRHISEVRRGFYLAELDSWVMGRSVALIRKYSLRAGDAIQLASAIEASSSTGKETVFVSSDRKLNDAANAEGLHPLDPAALSESEWRRALED